MLAAAANGIGILLDFATGKRRILTCEVFLILLLEALLNAHAYNCCHACFVDLVIDLIVLYDGVSSFAYLAWPWCKRTSPTRAAPARLARQRDTATTSMRCIFPLDMASDGGDGC